MKRACGVRGAWNLAPTVQNQTMSDEPEDLTEDQKAVANVIIKLVEAGWIFQTARRGSKVKWIPTPKGLQAAGLMRELISKFGAAGISDKEIKGFFWLVIQEHFSVPKQGDRPGDPRR